MALSRRRFLVLAPASVAALLAACSGSKPTQVVVKSAPPLQGTPTPTQDTSEPIPPPEIDLSEDTIPQAGTALLSLVGQVTGGQVKLLDRVYPLTQGSRSIYAFIGIDAEDPPGDHRMDVEFILENGSRGVLQEQVTIIHTQWPIDAVTLPTAFLAQLLDPATTGREEGFLKTIYSVYTPQKLWKSEEAWRLPVNGILTTRFGEVRSYNGSEPSGHHSGTDIGADAGDPVLATNSGRVAMARQLELRGNMVIIDHGGGLFSGYAHMRSFSVAEGQMVAAGETVGEVGTSGLSTGAHLHWEMSAGGVLVDALRFTDGSNGF
ncbi:MAG: M23 family metallopeptidase [Dehalococcoidia bacterium]|nr:M23 family metallopeptidase [Dehalococcoidia bacterium]MCB9486334.1 M23 family metallopeptidase [Thermoflexaceae bacterium]